MRSCNYWVFREGRRSVHGPELRSGLVAALQALRSGGDEELDHALLRAGELETALVDAGGEDAAASAVITNALAAALAGLWNSDVGLDSLACAAERLDVPNALNISTPEGFSYYALHPLAFVELAEGMELHSRTAAVIGIRSIGATLSAVVTAALAKRGVAAQRTTVRPSGHPYDRKTQFTAAQLRWIGAQRAREAEFLVVDEGPGLSGSSFLSVGEALLEAGVERRRIHFLCNRQPEPEKLSAPRAAQRWRGFQVHCVSDKIPRLPCDAEVYCSGGQWRSWLYPREQDWPSSWTNMERVKFLSRDRQRIFKFEGHGPFGGSVVDRARLLADSGFGPILRGTSGGFAEFTVIKGRPAKRGDLSREIIERIADYCAMRAVEFRTEQPKSPLQEMAQYNLGELLGVSVIREIVLEEREAAVVCDARMQPHEWIIRPGGPPLKTDGEGHGDDHFFPGPCDIAWDLAGAAMEWEMNRDATDALLRRYQLRAGDDVRRRFEAYAITYLAFRTAYCRMAAFALQGTAEEARLQHDAESYKLVLNRRMATPELETTNLSSMVSLIDTM